MALNFPTPTTIGQQYTYDLVTYTWNGTFWQSNGLSGAKGDKGEVGSKGDKGDSVKGDVGAKGEIGEQGIAGTAAAKGDKGDKGFVGTQGVKGVKGERVTVWKSSFPPEDTELLWYNTVDGNFLIYYNDGDTPYWVDASPTVVGDKGDKGQKGDPILTLENAVVSNTLTANITNITTANVNNLTANVTNITSANVNNLTANVTNIATSNVNNLTANVANVNNLTAVNGIFTGNVTVSGTTTYINTTQLDIGDNIVSLNADLPSNTAPTENAGISVNRGSSANVQLIWDESSDYWTIGNTTFYANNISTTYVNGVEPVTTGKAIAMAIVFGG